MTIRAVLVGAGKVGAAFAEDPVMARHYRYASHAQVLAAHPELDWGAVVDVDPTVVTRVQQRWGVPRGGTSVADACRDFAPDLAIVATPPGERIALLDALPSLKAVLVEKPLGATEAEAVAFLDACRRRGVLVAVNLWRRTDDLLRELVRRRRELLGEVQTAFVLYGNGLHNNGTHMVDLVRMLLGEVVAVQSAADSLRDAHGPIQGDVHVSSMLTLTSGAVVHLAALDFRSYRENAIDAWGTMGRLQILQEGLSTAVSRVTENRAMQGEREVASDAPSVMGPTCGTAFCRMYDDVLAAMRGSAALASPGESALQSARLIDLIERSAREGGRRLTVKATP